MNRIDNKIMPTDHALGTLCFFCRFDPMAFAITKINRETGGGGANRFHGPYSQYMQRTRSGAAGKGLDTTIKYLRRTTSAAA